ncbi:hypothetical protein MP228_002937 [Amoeboaphelidium protococcarum]|nr:hypothetical protein MP228_002937 [Amoeboaphelidium protococcarum]
MQWCNKSVLSSIQYRTTMFSPGGTSLNTDLNAAPTASSSTTASAGDTVVSSNSPYTPTSIIHDPDIKIQNYCMLKLQKIICHGTSVSSLCYYSGTPQIACHLPLSRQSQSWNQTSPIISHVPCQIVNLLPITGPSQNANIVARQQPRSLSTYALFPKFEFSDDIMLDFTYARELESI